MKGSNYNFDHCCFYISTHTYIKETKKENHKQVLFDYKFAYYGGKDSGYKSPFDHILLIQLLCLIIETTHDHIDYIYKLSNQSLDKLAIFYNLLNHSLDI